MNPPLLFLLLLMPTAAVAAAPDEPKPIAFELQKEVLFVKASIGDSGPLDLVLDSGTIHTTLDEAVATRIGLDLSMRTAPARKEYRKSRSLRTKYCGSAECR